MKPHHALAVLVVLVFCALTACEAQRPGAAPEASEPDTPAATASGLPEGWRWESFGDLQVGVPASWTYGNLSQWCVGATGTERRTPRVQRPYGASTLVACTGDGGYGIAFTRAGDRAGAPTAPSGAEVRRVGFATGRATIVARTADLADRVAATATRIAEIDVHGCAPDAPLPRLDTFTDAADPGSASISVCRYVRTGGRVLLDASERLSPQDADTLRTALANAPSGRGPDAPRSSCIRGPERQAVALVFDARMAAWVHYDGCRGHGVDLGADGTRRVTAALLHWALSPGWSGGLSGGVPFPELRPLASTSP